MPNWMAFRVLLGSLVLLNVGREASGLVGLDGPQLIQPLAGRPLLMDLRLLPKPDSFQLNHSAIKQRNQSLLKAIERELGERRRLPIGFGLQEETSGLQLTSDQDQVTARIAFAGHPLCNGGIRAVRLRDGSLRVMTSPMPGSTVSEPLFKDFPPSEQVGGFVEEYAASQTGEYGGTTRILEKCWTIDEQQLVPAVWASFHIDRLPYRALITNDGMTKVEPLFFGAVGRAVVFAKNPTDEAKTIFSLGDLKGTGKLESSAFTTYVNKAKKAEQCDHVFDYDQDDERFAEASAFTHANRALSWFSSFLGYKWTDSPLTIRIHEEIGSPPNEKNNALYQPATASVDALPNILIGDGDGKQLQNLPLDQDVVSHEFGHHIVYRTLKSTVRESLVLHEGLADFFTYARTDNACLGESICPEGSQFCWTESCLRTAENDLKFTDSDLPSQAHLRSQFISGMLWDLKTKQSMAIGDVARIAYKAVDFFASEMVYEQFISAMLTADKEIFEGANCQKILDTATERGLGARISNLKCDAALQLEGGPARLAETATDTDENYILKVSEAAIDAIATTSLCVTKPKQPGDLATPCGVVGGEGYTPTDGLAAIFFLIPALFYGFQIGRRRRTMN